MSWGFEPLVTCSQTTFWYPSNQNKSIKREYNVKVFFVKNPAEDVAKRQTMVWLPVESIVPPGNRFTQPGATIDSTDKSSHRYQIAQLRTLYCIANVRKCLGNPVNWDPAECHYKCFVCDEKSDVSTFAWPSNKQVCRDWEMSLEVTLTDKQRQKRCSWRTTASAGQVVWHTYSVTHIVYSNQRVAASQAHSHETGIV
jgi:hypothetical protein